MATKRAHVCFVLLTMMIPGTCLIACKMPSEDVLYAGYRTQCDFNYHNQTSAQPLQQINKVPTQQQLVQKLNTAQQRRICILKNQINKK